MIRQVTYGSICSGIESASVAWEPLGMEVQWFAEIEKFPSAVLAHHWPDVANLGDMIPLPGWVKGGLVSAPDILVGGTPCQAFSVAGLRKGLDDERGQLTLKFVELANEIDRKRDRGDECVVVWENVPGVLSTKDNAFGCFLGALAGEDCELKPSGKKWTNAGIVHGPERTIAWRVLDAQYFGVAQRRRRVFVVASARDRFCPEKVLFESEGVRWDIKPSRPTREETSGTVAECFREGSFGQYVEGEVGTLKASGGVLSGGSETFLAVPIHDRATRYRGASGKGSGNGLGVGADNDPSFTLTTGDNHAVCVSSQEWPAELASTLNASFGDKLGLENQHINSGAPLFVLATCIQGSMVGRSDSAGPQGSGVNENISFTLNTADRHAVCFEPRSPDGVPRIKGDLSPTLNTMSGGQREPCIYTAESVVRRLTPEECESLQGFPRGHTRIPWRKKGEDECPDGPRYKAIGNSKAVPVIKWVGERILEELNRES